MSILIYTENENGNLKKSAFELASYGKALADNANTALNAITINSNNESDLAAYGVEKTFIPFRTTFGTKLNEFGRKKSEKNEKIPKT